MADIEFRYGNNLDLDQVLDLYKESTLGERRPIDDREIMSGMKIGFTRYDSAWVLSASDTFPIC